MKTFNHCIQHLITQQTDLGSLIAKALHSEQTKKLVSNALSLKLQALITDIHVEDGIVSFLCGTAEKATLVRFESIDLLSALRQSPKLGHIKKIQVRVVPTFLQTQNNHFTTGNSPSALESVTDNNHEKIKINKISRLTANQLILLAENLGTQPGSEALKASLEKLARRQ
jgi:hypothetical protein